MSVRQPPTPYAELLAHEDVRGAIERALRKRLPADEIEDGVQEVLARALAMPPVDALEAASRRVVAIAKNYAIDVLRKRATRGDGKGRVDPDATAHRGRDPDARIDDRRRAAVVAHARDEGRIDDVMIDMFDAQAGGATNEKIAEEHRMAPKTVRNRFARARAYVREHWAVFAATGTLAVLVAILAYVLSRPEHPDVAQPETKPDETQRAAELRKEGLAYCDDKAWRACLERLDEARALDPKGDERAEVRAARSAAEIALQPPPPGTNVPALPPTGDR